MKKENEGLSEGKNRTMKLTVAYTSKGNGINTPKKIYCIPMILHQCLQQPRKGNKFGVIS